MNIARQILNSVLFPMLKVTLNIKHHAAPLMQMDYISGLRNRLGDEGKIKQAYSARNDPCSPFNEASRAATHDAVKRYLTPSEKIKAGFRLEFL